MAAGMCLSGHVVDDIESYRNEECLLLRRMAGFFQFVERQLLSLEGCYLYWDRKKLKWIGSGKTTGEGADACFGGRGKKHWENSKSKDEMRVHPLYAAYPARGVENLGAREGYFDNLDMCCALAFDRKSDVMPLLSDSDDGLFVWSKESMDELKKRGGDLKTVQLDMVAYLWELCYDLLLANGENVSVSPGFEVFGLRQNRIRREEEESERDA